MNSNRWTEMKYSFLSVIAFLAVGWLLYLLQLLVHAMGPPYGLLAILAMMATACFVAFRWWWCDELRRQASRDYKELTELRERYEHLKEASQSICDSNERLRNENKRLSQKQESFDKAYEHLWDEYERLREENERTQAREAP